MERRLTEAVIPALRTKKAQEEVYHSGTPSAGIRVTRDGAKTFFIRYRSPTVKRKDSAEPVLRRFYFGEHKSGKPGEARYLSLKEFESAYTVFRGQLAAGVDPQPQGRRSSSHRLAAPVHEDSARVVSADLVPSSLRKLFPKGYAVGSISALLADYFEHHGPHLSAKTLRGYQETAARPVIPRLGFVPILSLTVQEVRQTLTEVRTPPRIWRARSRRCYPARSSMALRTCPG
jgi:hypothetical protein